MHCWTICISPGAAMTVSKAMTVATCQMGAPAFNGPLAPCKLDLYLVSSSQIHALFKLAVRFAPNSAFRGRSSALITNFIKIK
eukprot:1159547-Pelagomonas_calceolata.AAC.2